MTNRPCFTPPQLTITHKMIAEPDFILEIGATCYRTEKAQIRKSAGDRPPGTVPSGPPFPSTLPSTLRSTFSDLGFLSPAAGGDLNFILL